MSRDQSPMAAANSARDDGNAGVSSRASGFHAARLERSRFKLDLRRSLRRHRGLALGIALAGILAAATYLLAYWPVYSAEALVYIQPAPVVQTVQGVTMHWPYNYDPASYESYVQQQMASMTRQDVLQDALSKLSGFRTSGESDEQAIQRLRKSLEVRRIGNSYEVSIKSLARSARMSADIANTVASSYVDNTARAQQAVDAGRMTILRAEADRAKDELQTARAEQARIRPAGAAGTAVQPEDLSGEIARLQRRYEALDGEIQDLSIDDAAPGTAHVALTAVAPASPVADGVVPTAVFFAAAFLLLAVLAAVLAHKLNPRVYVAGDLERLLGFGPIVELPDLSEVPEEIFEGQLVRLSAAVDGVIGTGKQNCVFTGAGPATGVTTVATRVRLLMEGMGRTAVLVNAAGSGPGEWSGAAEDDQTRSQSAMLEEVRARDGSVVLADAAPLSLSAETEYLVRNSDCVIVVVESGVTTRAQLRATSRVLQRLEASVVGYVVNRVGLADAEPAFRDALATIEARVLQKRKSEEERVRTRKVEVRETAAAQEPAPELVRMTEITPQPAAPSAASEPVRRFASMRQEAAASAAARQPLPPRGRVEGVPQPQMKVAAAAQAEASQKEVQVPAPWWLTDSLQTPTGAALPREEQAAGGPGAAAESVAGPQESRLSGLRKLFIKRNAEAAAAAPEQGSGVVQTTRRFSGGVPVPEVSDLFRRDAEEPGEAPKRRGTPMVTTAPEILPPRKTEEAKRDPDAASRRERRGTWDDLSVLPSWRGQYRRKD